MEVHSIPAGPAKARWPGFLPNQPTPRVSPPHAGCDTCAARGRCLPSGLNDSAYVALTRLLTGRRQLRKGQKLYRAGQPFNYLYAVRVGTFKSVFPLDDGGEHVSAFHLPGDLMGFDGVADSRHPTTTIALENAEACPIPYAQLMEACATSPSLFKRVSQLMGLQLVHDHRCTRRLAGRHAEERVAGFLLQLSERMRERGYSPHEFQLRMSRADIGSYVGTTLETVSRSLSLFAREGFITVHSRRIQLVDVEQLNAFFADRHGAAASKPHRLPAADTR